MSAYIKGVFIDENCVYSWNSWNMFAIMKSMCLDKKYVLDEIVFIDENDCINEKYVHLRKVSFRWKVYVLMKHVCINEKYV